MTPYKLSESQHRSIRNNVFLEVGIPILQKNGFTKSPFSTAWFGRNNLSDYTYEMCRIAEGSHLQIIETHINKGDSWIKIYLNIFELHPTVKSVHELENVDGLQFHLPPNKLSKFRLGLDDIRGIPLFSYRFMFAGHRLKKFRSEKGLKKRIEQLSVVVRKDLTNIDGFIKMWHKKHTPLVTDWEGKIN